MTTLVSFANPRSLGALAGSKFLMGLLQARENDRIGAGPASFIQIQTHAWYDGVDWEATLRREVTVPWIPPPNDDGAVDVGIDFSREDVMLDRQYATEQWAETFKDFGPYRTASWAGEDR